MNATGRVNSPIKSRNPPATSIMPAIPSNEKLGNPVYGGPGGYPNSFCVPCSRNSSAPTIRSTLRRYGVHLAGIRRMLSCSPNTVNYQLTHRPACFYASLTACGPVNFYLQNFGEENE